MTSSTPISTTQTKINENSLQTNSINDAEKEKGEEKEDNNYRHLYIVIEHEEGTILPVSFEMLGEGRRLMDDFNDRYKPEEKVVAVVLGHDIKYLGQDLINHGADVVIYADHPELRYSRNLIYTRIIYQIVTDKACAAQISSLVLSNPTFIKPRYMFFSADDTGRHLSSTVMAELESGLASDINKLVINDLEIRHEHKTKGKPIVYKKTLEMYRPDFSGFLWTTILCLDNLNPENKKKNFILRLAV